MKVNKFLYESRNCCACEGDSTENLWSYSHLARTRNYNWLFEINNVICKRCGFVFVSPAPVADELKNYYSDMLVYYSNQELDYDVDARLQLISRYKGKSECFMELGSNEKNRFSQEINKIFSKVVTVEPNSAIESDHESIFDVPSDSISMIANYFVLEHISNISEIFQQFKRVIIEDGILICEVPDIRMYPDNITACHQHEHLNHFSPVALAAIAQRYGFVEIESSVKLCSRYYGFVSVFKLQMNEKPHNYNINEYDVNKKLFHAGSEKAIKVLEHFDVAREKIQSLLFDGVPFIVWGANENYFQLIKDLPNNSKIICIDSNPDKKNSLPGLVIHTPDTASKFIQASEFIFICAGRHSNAILDYINLNYKKNYDKNKIYLLDREVL